MEQNGANEKRRLRRFSEEDEAKLGVLAATANDCHAKYNHKWRLLLPYAKTAGEALIEVKRVVGHGNFIPWVEHNFDGSVRTAQKYMRVARHWERLQVILADHPTLTVEECLDQIAAHDDDQEGGAEADAGAAAVGGPPEMREADLRAPEPSHVKMVLLMLNVNTCPVFQGWVKAIGQRYGIENATDVVYNVMRWAHLHLCGDGELPGPDIPFPAPKAPAYDVVVGSADFGRVVLRFDRMALAAFQDKVGYLARRFGTKNHDSVVVKAVDALYDGEKAKEASGEIGSTA